MRSLEHESIQSGRELIEASYKWAKRLAPIIAILLLRGESARMTPPIFDGTVKEPKKVCPNERYELGASPWGEESRSDIYGCGVEVIKGDDDLYHVYVGPPFEDSE